MRVSVGLKQRNKLLKQTETYKEWKARTDAWLVSLRLPHTSESLARNLLKTIILLFHYTELSDDRVVYIREWQTKAHRPNLAIYLS